MDKNIDDLDECSVGIKNSVKLWKIQITWKKFLVTLIFDSLFIFCLCNYASLLLDLGLQVKCQKFVFFSEN